MKLFVSIASLFVLISLLTSWNHYQVAPLAQIVTGTEVFVKQQEEIKVFAKLYTPEESKAYLHEDLSRQGYKVVQVTIENNTPKTYYIPDYATSLPAVEPTKVVWTITSKSIPRAIAFKIASFVFMPLTVISTIDSLKTHDAFRKLKKDYRAKGIREEPIAPYSTVNRVIFIKSSKYFEPFTVTLLDKDTDTLKNFSCHPST